jgi:hypothetical protein
MSAVENQELIHKDYFGFLDYKATIEFEQGRISQIEDFDDIASQVDKYINIDDGFIYPPLSWKVDGEGNKIPNTERVSWKQPVPPSHQLFFHFPDTKENLRQGKGAYVIHLLAYLFGVRLQFYDWWFDGRIPHRQTHNVNFSSDTLAHFLSHSISKWESLGQEVKRLFINVLYMHSRVPIYQWDWERFAIEYMVFDGLYKLLCLIIGKNPKSEKHTERINFVCEYFGIPIKKDFVEDIVRLRNQLFHETLWSNSQPGTVVEGSAFFQAYNLRRLNQRIIPALLDYRNEYVKTGWWFAGSYSFEKPI